MYCIFDRPINVYLYPSADLVNTKELEKEYSVDLKGTKMYKLVAVNEKDMVLPLDLYIRTRYVNIDGEMKRETIQNLFKDTLFNNQNDKGCSKISLDRLLDDIKWILCKTTWNGHDYFVHMSIRSDYNAEYGPLEMYLKFAGDSENDLIKAIKKKVIKRM